MDRLFITRFFPVKRLVLVCKDASMVAPRVFFQKLMCNHQWATAILSFPNNPFYNALWHFRHPGNINILACKALILFLVPCLLCTPVWCLKNFGKFRTGQNLQTLCLLGPILPVGWPVIMTLTKWFTLVPRRSLLLTSRMTAVSRLLGNQSVYMLIEPHTLHVTAA